MMDHFEFETTPYDERCSQIGDDEYTRDSILECRVLQRQIVRQIGDPPEGAYFYRKSNSHEFGIYHELALKYDDEDETHIKYMLKVERDFPAKWDDQSIEELKAGDYSLLN